MKNNPTVAETTEEILQSILATPKKQRRIKSSTFWKKFGIERRSKEKIEIVKKALKECNIFFESDEQIGVEPMDKMVKLSYLEPEFTEIFQKASEKVLNQDDSWFEALENRVFASEREVEQYFIAPILKKLDYDDEDCAIGFRLITHKGVKKERKEVDFAVFDGSLREKEKALIVVEAKSSEKKLTDDAIGQAHSYAVELSTPLITL
ncbi:MAG: type I restriction enzyme HsdR N-terminal domain-containing protein [Pyrinomonadaceae bacterium]|nr:type I restriction enzyme HsdR N-terminal domain-containing protein [Pyrinomonadaceae bacterium]